MCQRPNTARAHRQLSNPPRTALTHRHVVHGRPRGRHSAPASRDSETRRLAFPGQRSAAPHSPRPAPHSPRPALSPPPTDLQVHVVDAAVDGRREALDGGVVAGYAVDALGVEPALLHQRRAQLHDPRHERVRFALPGGTRDAGAVRDGRHRADGVGLVADSHTEVGRGR